MSNVIHTTYVGAPFILLPRDRSTAVHEACVSPWGPIQRHSGLHTDIAHPDVSLDGASRIPIYRSMELVPQ